MKDHCRNNVGNWPTREVMAPRDARGFDCYSVKDRAMAEAAEYGLMLWDGKSKGTINNVVNLSRHHKPAIRSGRADGVRGPCGGRLRVRWRRPGKGWLIAWCMLGECSTIPALRGRKELLAPDLSAECDAEAFRVCRNRSTPW